MISSSKSTSSSTVKQSLWRQDSLPWINAMAVRAVGNWLAPGGARARLTILVYHRVLSQPDPLLPDEYDRLNFAWQVRLLAEHFNVLSLSEAMERLPRGSLPPRAICITFDDGYRDNVEHALPVLIENKLPATFFISTAFLEGDCMWNDIVIESIRSASGLVLDLEDRGLGRHSLATPENRARTVQSLLRAIKYFDHGERLKAVELVRERAKVDSPRGIMMRPEQLHQLVRAGMDIGGHTMSHPILTRIEDADAAAEISRGKRVLEEMIGRSVRFFAYPNGIPRRDYDQRHVQMVRNSGFDAAVTTSPGSVRGSSDRFQMPRFSPWDREPTRFVYRLLSHFQQVGDVA